MQLTVRLTRQYGIILSDFIRIFNADWSIRVSTLVRQGHKPGHDLLTSGQNLMAKLLASFGPNKLLWAAFWIMYSSMGIDDKFTTDYMNAWRLKVAYIILNRTTPPATASGNEHTIYVLSDNHHPLQIPCFPSMTDHELICHIRNFYYLGIENDSRYAIFTMRTTYFIDKVQTSNLSMCATYVVNGKPVYSTCQRWK